MTRKGRAVPAGVPATRGIAGPPPGRLRAAMFALIATGLYAAVSFMLGLAGAASLGMDEVKISVLAQSFQWGYLPDNPPLFEWLVLAVQQITGPGVLSFVLVKTVLLVITLGCAIASFSAFGLAPGAAVLAGLSLLATYQYGWNLHQAFTHSAALVAVMAVFVWCAVGVYQSPRRARYIALGGALGLGILAKYSFLVLVLALAAGFLTTPVGRARLREPGALWTVGTALIIAAPHSIWLALNAGEVGARIAERTASDVGYGARVLAGLPEGGIALASFFLPLALLSLWLGRPALRAIGTLPAWLPRAGLAGTLLVPAVILVFGMDGFQERYALAFLYPALLVLIFGLVKAGSAPGRWRRFCLVVYTLIALFPAVRLAQAIYPGKPFCTDCRQWVAYGPLGDDLAAQMPISDPSRRTLVGFDDHTAGNLRLQFPQARIRSAHLLFYAPPIRAPIEACRFVWSQDLGPTPPILDRFEGQAIREVVAEWQHPFRRFGWRTTRWNHVDVPRDHPLFDGLCRGRATQAPKG